MGWLALDLQRRLQSGHLMELFDEIGEFSARRVTSAKVASESVVKKKTSGVPQNSDKHTRNCQMLFEL